VPRPDKPPKPVPFTEAQIRERAYELWQAQPEGSAAEHWDGAIEALRRERSLVWQVRRTLLRTWWLPGEKGLRAFPGNVYQVVRLAFHPETQGAALDIVKVVISAFGVLATVFAGVGLYLTYRTGQEQQRLAQQQLESAQQERQLNSERLVTDRFAKAVEQLGSPDIDVRIGAIYSLERIAKDSPKDHWTIMEVLTAFVRNKSPLPKDWKPDSKQKLPEVTADVQSALTVIGRREVKNDLAGKHLNLSETNLDSADLQGADLSRAYLLRTNLDSADLEGTDLNETALLVANLNGAILYNANLSKAELSGANLKNSYLRRVNLGGANLGTAHFTKAQLITSTNLENADLRGAYNLIAAQIKAAKNWQYAHYDPEFRKQLGLPPEKH